MGRSANVLVVGLPLAAFLGLAAWRLFFCSCEVGSDPAGFTAAAATLPETAPQAGAGPEAGGDAGLQPWPRLDLPPEPEVIVSWQDAGQWVDHVIGVEGEVVLTHDSGKACFLNFAQNWRGKFRGVIFASSYNEYPRPPAEYLRRRRVRLLGRVQRYRGAPEIVVDSPAQIVLLDAPGR